jgi:hypothetical protein
MAAISEAKRRKAFQLRVQGKTITDAAREAGISRCTLRRLETGWIDKRGVRHRGWKHDLDAARDQARAGEAQGGFSVKEARIKAYEELAEQAIEIVRSQFPTIRMKNATDAKALLSEIRELGRLIATEKGEHAGPAKIVAVRASLTSDEMQRRFVEAMAVEVEEISPPAQQHAGAEPPAPRGIDEAQDHDDRDEDDE